MKYKYCLLDLDGTLTDPGIGITNSVKYSLKKFGIEVADRSELYSFIGPPLPDSFKRVFGFSDEQADEDLSYAALMALSDRDTDIILKDMEECYSYLKKTCKLGASSNALQGLSELFAMTDGNHQEKCERIAALYKLLKEKKAEVSYGIVSPAAGNTFITGSLELIKAGQTALMVNIILNVAPSMLSSCSKKEEEPATE